jgi:hypothetical protein
MIVIDRSEKKKDILLSILVEEWTELKKMAMPTVRTSAFKNSLSY